MAITRATDLTVAKSDASAEAIAAACWDAANELDAGSAKLASIRRQLKRHAHELLELHNIKADEVLVTGNGARLGDFSPTHTES
jgi:hypothetical protein